jgi:hypothetical protein
MNNGTTEQSRFSLGKKKTDSHGSVITVISLMARHGLRTERKGQCGGNSHPRDASNEQR